MLFTLKTTTVPKNEEFSFIPCSLNPGIFRPAKGAPAKCPDIPNRPVVRATFWQGPAPVRRALYHPFSDLKTNFLLRVIRAHA